LLTDLTVTDEHGAYEAAILNAYARQAVSQGARRSMLLKKRRVRCGWAAPGLSLA